MTLRPGARLGPYEITAKIGEGGMGEVWRATDTSLRRQVAIKILSGPFAQDAERLARLEREARTLASLNHPHIAQIFGLERLTAVFDGAQGREAGSPTTALVMELVEGPTLADRIKRGPIPAAEAVTIARQIAVALTAAHECGIVHRDLKPSNVVLRPDGTAKVLDFGLAKAIAPATVAADALNTTTAAIHATRDGVILGTPAYMSPEQATGGVVDVRTDIWAFGCLVYEMLTGRRAFGGATVPETSAAVLAGTPDWSRLPADVSPALRVLLRRCLARDPRERISTMSAVSFVLEEERSLSVDPAGPQRRSSTTAKRVAVALATAMVLAAAATTAFLAWQAPPPQPIVRTIIAAPLFTIGTDRNFGFVSDGSQVAYVRDDGAQVLVRALDALEPTAILTTQAFLRGLFPSVDGRWLGFVENNFVLRKIAAVGGVPVTIATVDGPTRGAAWGPDDSIVFASAAVETGLQQVPASGGSVTVLTRPDRARGEQDHTEPSWLPDGRGILFTVTAQQGGANAARIALLDRETGTWRTLIAGGSRALYADSGHLVYVAAGALWAVRFDLERQTVTGDPVEMVPSGAIGTTPQFDISRGGTLVYPRGARDIGTGLSVPTWVDRSGRETPVGLPPATYYHPRISPDGRRLAIARGGDIYIWDLEKPAQDATRLTFAPGIDWFPVWTPDGRQIVFGSWRGGGFSNVYVQEPDAGMARRLTDSPDMQSPTAITPDGRTVVFHSFPKDLHAMPLDEGGQARTLVDSALEERNAALSPDGRWIAYEGEVAASPGMLNVYVRPFPDTGRAVWQVSTGGGTFPRWAPEGRELFYFRPDATMVAVAVEATATGWTTGAVTSLFRGPYMVRDGTLGRAYDVAADGRFLMLKEQYNRDAAHLVVVQNWLTELTDKVP